MSTEAENENLVQEGGFGSCLLWFFWGASLSFLTILSLVLLVMLIGSVALNAYLAWQLAGLELSVSRRGVLPLEETIPLPTTMLAAIPTNTPASTPSGSPPPGPTEALLAAQFATLSAVATEVAAASPPGMPLAAPPPTATPTPRPPPGAVPPATIALSEAAQNSSEELPAATPTPESTQEAVATQLESTPVASADEAALFAPPATSSNSYTMIPLEQPRDSRPPDEHGDLNLKLREPQPSSAEPTLVEIPGSGVDPSSLKLSSVFEPNFVATYAVYDWDWGCNCPGDLLPEDEAVLVGIETMPGEPIFIPKTERDIYDGKYYAVVLYASEDSLTFVYARNGTVASGYTVHYLGLHTDPNLLALYRDSPANELPGLTLETPVGVAASDELIVAVRDNGKFLDARSKKDWWE